MKSISFVSNMVVEPVGKMLEGAYEIEYRDLDSIVSTLSGRVESDYLVILLESRFFYEFYPDEASLQRVEFLHELIEGFRERNEAKVILSNLFDSFAFIESGLSQENIRALTEINLSIEKIKTGVSDVEICDLYSLGLRFGFDRLYNQRNRFLFQAPFTRKGAAEVALEIERAIARISRKRKKVLLLDGDNTLWGGIVGEDGIYGVACDENYPGIAYKRFQLYLAALRRSGLVLALVSKNNEEDLIELFEKRDMPLSMSDFVSWRIDWRPKSLNISEIASELNLGIESFLFIDDNPFEIEEVKNALPEIDTLLFDKENPLAMIERLSAVEGVCAHMVTEEDRNKSEQYRSEKRRAEVFGKSADMESFIKSLGIEILWWENEHSQLARISQLLNKTNQFNLTTKRYTQAEVEKMMREHTVLSFRVKDRFGDMGIVGVMILKDCFIDTFLLSCRVLGRGIEERIMDVAIERCGTSLRALYIPSQKNSQVENLYERLGFELLSVGEDGSKEYRFVSKKANRDYMSLKEGE